MTGRRFDQIAASSAMLRDECALAGWKANTIAGRR
jgi:hypothetical protein